MTSGLSLYFRHSRLRHSLICPHQAESATASGLAWASRTCTISSCSTSFTSPTIGMSTLTRFEIDDGSMSMWTILRSTDAKCFGLPITRSSKRAPTASSTSQCCIVMLAS